MHNADVGGLRTFRYNYSHVDLEGFTLCSGFDIKDKLKSNPEISWENKIGD